MHEFIQDNKLMAMYATIAKRKICGAPALQPKPRCIEAACALLKRKNATISSIITNEWHIAIKKVGDNHFPFYAFGQELSRFSCNLNYDRFNIDIKPVVSVACGSERTSHTGFHVN